jgi:translation initiation factor 4B
LPDLPSRGGDRRDSGRGGFGGDFGGERRERGAPEGDGKIRDFSNWERKGPLSPAAQPERSGPRDGGRPRTNDGPRPEGFRERRASPAQWGEGRPQGSQDGSRPPRREFQERPAVERAPTAAEQDSQWRTKMRPDAPAKSPVPSRDGSEAPSSPSVAPATLPGGRPKLNLAKRTVSQAPDLPSPSSVSGDAKASPFGAARPIDTAAKERELEEKRLAAITEKKEAEEKVKVEAKEAAEKAKAEAAEKAEEDASKKVEILQREETVETENANGEIVDDKSVKPKEIVRDARPRPVETGGAWRRQSNGPPTPRDETPRGPRDTRGRGGRGRGEGRGGRQHYDDRGPRRDINGGKSPASPAQPPKEATETAAMEEDGWSTVSKPKKNNTNNRGGNQSSRAIAS